MNCELYSYLPHGSSFHAIAAFTLTSDIGSSDISTTRNVEAVVEPGTLGLPFVLKRDGRDWLYSSSLTELLAQLSGVGVVPSSDGKSRVSLLKVDSFCSRQPLINCVARLTVRAVIEAEVNGVASVEGSLWADDSVVARGRVTTLRLPITCTGG